MAKSRKSRRGGNEDPKKPQPETIPAASIPSSEPANVPSLGPDPPGPTMPATLPPRRERASTMVATDSEDPQGGRRKSRKSRQTRKLRKSRKYSRRR